MAARKKVPQANNPAGYSGTPLVKKLGIKPQECVLTFGAPAGFAKTLGPLPEGARLDALVKSKSGTCDRLIVFVNSRKELRERLDIVDVPIRLGLTAWIAWPKKSSGIVTDLTEDGIREEILPRGFVDTKVCAIDATWSGLRISARRTSA